MIVVLGMGPLPVSPILDRTELATKLFIALTPRKVIVSGGQVADEPESEAHFMRQKLEAAGVPSQAIIEEASSATTYENLLISREILKANHLSQSPVLIATHAFHAARAAEIAEALGYDATVISTEGPRLDWMPIRYLREMISYWKWRLMRRGWLGATASLRPEG